MSNSRRGLLCALLALIGLPLAGQALFWERPVELVSGARIRHSLSASGGGLMIVAWQEIIPRSRGADEGTISLSLVASRDGKAWSKPNKGFFPPITYKGLSAGIEPRVYSVAVDSKGLILVAVARSERGIAILQSADGGQSFQTAAVLQAGEVLVAPSLYESASGGFILLAARASAPQGGDPITLVCSTSSDGRSWSAFAPLVPPGEPGAGLQLQPDHAAYQGRDFVVYQSQDERLAYHLYFKESVDGGRTWEPARAITTRPQFGATVASTRYGPGEFSNQRPRLTALDDGLALAWERNLLGDNRPQVFFCRLGLTGEPAGQIEQVTTGASAVFARIVPFRGRIFVLYADSAAGGSRVTLVEKKRTWEVQFQDRRGSSQFPHAAVLGDSLYFFWEREEGGVTALVDLSPDTSVDSPRLTAADPAPGSASRRGTATVEWTRVEDSSGVREYRYSWSLAAGGRDVVKKTGSVAGVSASLLASSIDLDQDGAWTFTVSAVDAAANVSPALSVSFVRDTTPPGAVAFSGFPAGAVTPLPSNDVVLSWTSADPDVLSYRWESQRVGANEEEYRATPPALRPPPPSQSVQATERRFQNLENGVWAFTVQAVDAAGNVGPATTAFAFLGNYVPLAVVWSVLENTDELGSVTLGIRGKGFLTAGRIQQVVLDVDGRAPWDMTFQPGDEGFVIVSDGGITGPRLTNASPAGLYRVGIVHPTRGPDPWFVPGFRFRFKSPGTVKIGNFELPLPDWIAGNIPRITVSVDALLVVALVAFLVVLAILAARRVAAIAHEGAVMSAEIVALIEGRPSAGMEERKKRMKELRRKGAGLRVKFTLLVVVLVILVVLIVAVPLGYQMTNNQQTVLASGLSKQSEILIGSLTSAATVQIKLAAQGYADMANVPASRRAMTEALYATVSGPSTDPAANAEPDFLRDYVWASDEARWQTRRDAGTFQPARETVDDQLARDGVALAFQQEIDGKLAEALGPMVAQYRDTLALVRALQGKTDAASIRRYNEAFSALAPKRGEIEKALAEQLAALKPFRSYPAFETRTPVDTYVFYYPIVYFAPDDQYYYHGMVRLAVGTRAIREAIGQAQLGLLRTTGGIALLAVALGVLGAIILASITVTPIRRLVKGVAVIRDTEDKEQLKGHSISVGTRDEIGLLAETVNEMTQGLVKAAAANKMLLLGKDVQKMFMPLEKDKQRKKTSTAAEETRLFEMYAYYEGAKEVSGDFFDFRKLDDTHYAFIKSDASGKGVPAALIMVEVATLFLNFFRDWQKRKVNVLGIKDAKVREHAMSELQRVDALVYTINDMVEEREFSGLFATLLVGVLDLETGTATVCHAGDRDLHIFKNSERRMVVSKLPMAPAAGMMSSKNPDERLRAKFNQAQLRLEKGDALFLFTDGFEDARRHFRNASLEIVPCDEPGLKEHEDHLGTHEKGADWEGLGVPRIEEIVNAVFTRERYRLIRHHLASPEELTFDFSTCAGNVKEAVLALTAVEKVYRLIPDSNAGDENKVVVDSRIDEFLKGHFTQYAQYYSHRAAGEGGAYITFTHLREDDQYDDLTILVVRRK